MSTAAADGARPGSTAWRHLPPAGRPIAAAVSAGVPAVRERDREGLVEAVNRLAAADPAQVGLVLGTLLRLLMEEAHPDGLDGDDVREVLTGTVRTAAEWQPDVDPRVLLLLLAAALGVHDDDEQATRPAPEVLARHGLLLVGQLADRRPVAEQLTRTFAEIQRAQLND